MATAITKKPDKKVKNLGAPKRSGYIMTAEWGVPSAMVKADSKSRATELIVKWTLDIPGKSDPKEVETKTNEKTTKDTCNLNNFGGKYTRQSFYPCHSTRTLKKVTCTVIGKNSKGKGEPATAAREFKPPRAPSVGNWAFDASTGIVSWTIYTNAGADYQERYDTKYEVTITNTRTGKTWKQYDTSSTATEIPLTYNVGDVDLLAYNQYVKIHVDARARGFAGNSGEVTGTRDYYVSRPDPAPNITNVAISGKNNNDKCTVSLTTGWNAAHPVSRVKLGYLKDSTAATEADVPGAGDFTWTDFMDDANCSALSIPVGDIMPSSKGLHTWVMLKSWTLDEDRMCRYSEPKEVKGLFTPAPTAADDKIVICWARAGDDGESILVKLGWNADGQDDSDGTELSWSDDEYSWKSTKDPNTYEFEWSDPPYTWEGVTYQNSAEIYIRELAEGTKYFISARRYMEGDKTEYGPYCNKATAVTSEIPESLTAIVDRYVSTGGSLGVSWVLAGNGLQKEWRVVKVVNGEDDAIIAEGEGSIQSTQISAERLASLADNGDITLKVEASTGSGIVESDEHLVSILDNPTLTVTTPTPLTVQPFSFDVTCSTPSDLVVIITSQGAVGQFPIGVLRQTDGDTIHSDVYKPEWTEENDVFTATVTVPDALDFWNLGMYTLSVTAEDRTTGLRSEEQISEFGIEWATEAVDPYDYITLTPRDYVDEDEVHHQEVEIELTAPEDSSETDYYDIYRLTADGAQLIGQSFPLDYTAVDEYAPIGEGVDLAYRIAIRTVDGDVEFADIEYELGGNAMRFDWEGGSLELPYNISIGDTYKKDVDARAHLDGSIDGYWNSNVSRTASLTSDVIRLEMQEDIASARQLARYTGPVFVRTPDGSAYEADVQVTDLSTEGIISAIAIDATEIALTQEFMLPTPYEKEDEPEEESE